MTLSIEFGIELFGVALVLIFEGYKLTGGFEKNKVRWGLLFALFGGIFLIYAAITIFMVLLVPAG